MFAASLVRLVKRALGERTDLPASRTTARDVLFKAQPTQTPTINVQAAFIRHVFSKAVAWVSDPFCLSIAGLTLLVLVLSAGAFVITL